MANGDGRGMPADGTHDSPWATGSVPIPDPPPEQTPAATTPSAPGTTPTPPHASTPPLPHDIEEEIVGETYDTGDGTPLGTAEPTPADRRRWIAVSAIAVVAILAIGSFVVSRSGGESDSTASGSTVPASSASESTDADDEDADETPMTTPPPSTTDAGSAAGALGIERIDLPPILTSQTSPTEIVALSDTGDLHTISVPSGRVRTTPLLSGAAARTTGFSSNLIVTPDAAAVATNEGEITVAPRVGPAANAVVVDRDADVGMDLIGWQRGADGSSRFRAAVYSGGFDYEVRLISPAGVVEEVEETDPALGPWNEIQRPDGVRIVNDAGGAYLVNEDGTTERLIDGHVLASSIDHLVVRECDAQRQCAVSVLDQRTDERRPVDLATFSGPFSALPGVALSPDGTAIASFDPSNGELTIIDLIAGEETLTRANTWNQRMFWTADSDGVFYSSFEQPGVHLVSRDGSSFSFGEELGRMTQVGVRWPDEELADLGPPEPATVAVPTEAPIEISFFALGEISGVHRVDLLEQQAVTWPAPGLRGAGSGWLFPTADTVTALAADGSAGAIVRADGFEQFNDPVQQRGPRLPAGDGRYWTSQTRFRDGDVGMRRVDPAALGAPVGPEDELRLRPASLIGTDGRNAPIVAVGGDTYLAIDGELQRLTTGSLLAISADRAVIRECDDTGACVTAMVDRADGSQQPIEDERVAAALARDGERLLSGTEISPDGNVVVIDASTNTGTESVFVDLETGTATATSNRHVDQPIVWSPDGDFAVYHARREVMLYDRARAVLAPLVLPPSIAEVRALAPTAAVTDAASPG